MSVISEGQVHWMQQKGIRDMNTQSSLSHLQPPSWILLTANSLHCHQHHFHSPEHLTCCFLKWQYLLGKRRRNCLLLSFWGSWSRLWWTYSC